MKDTWNIANYDYCLPDDRIAKYPLKDRDKSLLLYFNNNKIEKKLFCDLPNLIDKNSLLVFNNTKVIQARLKFFKSTGAKIEIFCLEPLSPNNYEEIFITNSSCRWKVMIGNLRKWKEGDLQTKCKLKGSDLTVYAGYCRALNNMTHEIEFHWDNKDITFADILSTLGEIPIPPYLNRATEGSDNETYQTTYAKILGSVAAPTAGLHFTPGLREELASKGVNQTEITLHVGAGTFQPVKNEDIHKHRMHSETFVIKMDTLKQIIANLGNIIAVGTTSMRTLESLYYIGLKINNNPNINEFCVTQWEAYEEDSTISTKDALMAIVDYMNFHKIDFLTANTQIIIAPSFKFRIVSSLITNFHQPKSTLLLLVSAFVGEENRRNIYKYALDNGFRFLSYGDSSLLHNSNELI